MLSEDDMDELEEWIRKQVQGEEESIRDFTYMYRALCRRWKLNISEEKNHMAHIEEHAFTFCIPAEEQQG